MTGSAARLLVSALCAALIAGSPPTARAAEYPLPRPNEDLVGEPTQIRTVYEDTLAAIAQRYELGYLELLAANPDVDPWLPGEGTLVSLPTQYLLPEIRSGLVINLPELRLYYFPPDRPSVVTFPIGVGRRELQTPVTTTRVVSHIENPSWTPTEAARREHAERGEILPAIVPSGPDNPMGRFALQLALRGYFIHGTNQPFGVGQLVSRGCIRLYNQNITELSRLAKNGTPVHIINQPYKVGWANGQLYAEAHRHLYEDINRTALVARIVQATQTAGGDPRVPIRWELVDEVGLHPTGVPTPI